MVYGSELSILDVREISCGELWWLRNAIYARHGFSFTTPRARAVFENEGWYEPDPAVIRETAASYLTPPDRENVNLILRVEQQRCAR